MVDSGRDIAALLDEADLVEWGEKIDRLIPESFMMSLVQRLNVSRDACLPKEFVAMNKEVTVPLFSKVLSK